MARPPEGPPRQRNSTRDCTFRVAETAAEIGGGGGDRRKATASSSGTNIGPKHQSSTPHTVDRSRRPVEPELRDTGPPTRRPVDAQDGCFPRPLRGEVHPRDRESPRSPSPPLHRRPPPPPRVILPTIVVVRSHRTPMIRPYHSCPSRSSLLAVPLGTSDEPHQRNRLTAQTAQALSFPPLTSLPPPARQERRQFPWNLIPA